MKFAALLALAAAASPVAAGARPKALHDAPFAPKMVVVPAGTATLGSTEAETLRAGDVIIEVVPQDRP